MLFIGQYDSWYSNGNYCVICEHSDPSTEINQAEWLNSLNYVVQVLQWLQILVW